MRKLLLLTIPACGLALAAVLAATETYVRLTWDEKKGRPGFFVSDPARVERLAENYDGWFAGVPVRINSLGFRDDREYTLEKSPATFRILVLGDSVTFGHGALYEHTYPRLLEDRLRRWRPDVDWQVWNLGVPGYNTSQQLATLMDVGAAYQPDLVVVGFFENDLFGNTEPAVVSRGRALASRVRSWVRRNVYAVEWFRAQYLTLRYRLLATETERQALEALAAQDALLARGDTLADAGEQRLTDPPRRSAAEVEAERCTAPQATTFSAETFASTPGLDRWQAAVRRFHEMHERGEYPITFFVNAAPRVCSTADVFDDRGTREQDAVILSILGAGTPAVSSHDAFMHYRPSQMPAAGGHSFGNSNAVKADVLFEFLRDRVLPATPAWRGREERADAR